MFSPGKEHKKISRSTALSQSSGKLQRSQSDEYCSVPFSKLCVQLAWNLSATIHATLHMSDVR